MDLHTWTQNSMINYGQTPQQSKVAPQRQLEDTNFHYIFPEQGTNYTLLILNNVPVNIVK